MVREALRSYHGRVRSEFVSAFDEDRSPHEIAASFATGVFITSLPTLGTGLLLFVAIVYLFERVSRIALFASLIVLNPAAKWGVYAGSFWIGTRLLGPVPGVTLSEVSFSAGPAVVTRLLAGNLVLAVVFTVVGYVAVHRLVREYRKRDIEVDVEELLPEALVEQDVSTRDD